MNILVHRKNYAFALLALCTFTTTIKSADAAGANQNLANVNAGNESNRNLVKRVARAAGKAARIALPAAGLYYSFDLASCIGRYATSGMQTSLTGLMLGVPTVAD